MTRIVPVVVLWAIVGAVVASAADGRAAPAAVSRALGAGAAVDALPAWFGSVRAHAGLPAGLYLVEPASMLLQLSVPQRDTDGDGVADGSDLCPGDPGVREARGCTPPTTAGAALWRLQEDRACRTRYDQDLREWNRVNQLIDDALPAAVVSTVFVVLDFAALATAIAGLIIGLVGNDRGDEDLEDIGIGLGAGGGGGVVVFLIAGIIIEPDTPPPLPQPVPCVDYLALE